MAVPYYTSIDLTRNELQNARLHTLGSAPASPVLFQYYGDSTLGVPRYYDGTAWISLDYTKAPANSIANTAINGLAGVITGTRLSALAVPNANVAMGGFKLTGLSVTPTTAGDSVEYSWLVAKTLNFWGTPTGNVPMGGFKLTGLSTAPNATGDAVEWSYLNLRTLSSWAAPTANVPMGGFTLTGLNTAPSVAGQAAEYSWVLALIQAMDAGIPSKLPVAALATANVVTLSGFQTIDGVAYSAGSNNLRVLLGAAQTTASQRGVWVQSAGAWTRPTTEGASVELDTGAQWFVIGGTVNAGTTWQLTTAGPIVPGTTALAIVQNGAQTVYSATNGVLLTGNQFTAVPAPSGGLTVSAAGLAIDTTVVTRKFSMNIGDGAALSFAVPHNLGTQDVTIQVRRATTPFDVVICDMASTSTTSSTLTFNNIPTANQFRCTVTG